MSVIEIRNLTKYYGKNLGIKDVNLSVEQGEMLGFVGPNGAGKSTTIKVLLNIIFPTSGKATILGKDAATESKEIKKFTTYVPTDVRFYENLTAKELLERTLSFYKLKKGPEFERLVTLFGVEIEKKFSELSSGNKKKVAIVSALLPEPKVLILDEPTNGLDPLMQKLLFQELQTRVENGMTVLLSSHNLSEIQEYCPRVAFIKGGTILAVEDMTKDIKPEKIVTAWSGHGFETLQGLGIRIIEQNGTKFVFAYKGDAKPLADALSRADLLDFTVENRSLEDQFMELYKGGAE